MLKLRGIQYSCAPPHLIGVRPSSEIVSCAANHALVESVSQGATAPARSRILQLLDDTEHFVEAIKAMVKGS